MNEQCKQEGIADRTGFHFYRCSRKAKKDGYCFQHHPEAVAERERKSQERREASFKASPLGKLKHAREKNEALTTRLAEVEAERDQLVGVLSALLSRLDDHFGGPSSGDWIEQEQARKALRARKGEESNNGKA